MQTKALQIGKARLMQIPDAETRILAKLDELLDGMLALALGHYYQQSKFDKDTGQVVTNIYMREPDYKALAFLIENVIGKVPQRVEMTGKDGGPVRVVPWMTTQEAMRMGLLGDDAEEEEPVDAEFTEEPAEEASDEPS